MNQAAEVAHIEPSLWEFFTGTGDDEIVVANTQREAIEYMRSLIGEPESWRADCLDPENVLEIGWQTPMHFGEPMENGDRPLVPMSEVHRLNVSEGASIPYTIATMNPS